MTYQVTVSPSGHTFPIEEEELVLDAALNQGISFPYGCRSGVCGTCFGKVLSGEIFYPDGIPMGISEDDHEKGEALFCQAVAKSDLHIEVAEIEAASDIKIKTFPAKIISLHLLAPDVMEMTLKLPETERLQFLAGQYIEILLPDGRKRAFSLANAPFNDAFLELHIRHVKNGYFTPQVFEVMQKKELLRIEGPHGRFFLRKSSRPKILMGGGTGFAPLKGMIEQFIQEGVSEDVYLYWGGRAKKDLYSLSLAEKWAFQHEKIHFIPVLSESDEEDKWAGRTGLVHLAVVEDFKDLSGFDVYMSGPPPMVNAAVGVFEKHSLVSEQMFSDSFEFSEDTVKNL